jgi:hypothetical protein
MDSDYYTAWATFRNIAAVMAVLIAVGGSWYHRRARKREYNAMRSQDPNQ